MTNTMTLPSGAVVLANASGAAKSYMSISQALAAAEKAGGQHIKVGKRWCIQLKGRLDT